MFKEERNLYTHRCELFFKRLLPDRFLETLPLDAVYANTGTAHLSFSEKDALAYAPIHEGEDFGDAWESAWFHITGAIPTAWRGKEIAILLNLSGEVLIFDAQGCPVYAVTGHSVFNTSYHKDLYFPPATMTDTGHIDFWAEAAASSLFGVNLETDPHRIDTGIGGKFPGRILELRIGLFNREAWALRFDFEILLALFKTLPPDGYRARQLLTVMNAAIDAYGDDPANAAAARTVLAPELARHANDSALTAAAVGHAHIDVAWLWPVRETVRKAARTFASQLDLINRYPGYIFGASQAQLYQFIKDRYPLLFPKIQAAVKAGTWELQGGMWVEADCNIISGESMVRQFVHGKNFFMDEFGVEVKSLWLPDVFGYSAAAPQIIRKSGCDYFLTQKLSWNQFDTMPHNTFYWRGIDGSTVLTHFPPENTYNASATPEELCPAQDRFPEGDSLTEFASLFGLGDGGGGPSENHIERARRMHDLEGCPRVQFSKAGDFFKRLATSGATLPTWDGELYFELHRGTFTSQARTKRNNRKLEQLLQTAEFLAVCSPSAYPRETLHRLWRVLLLNQFHDIIPGSSIQPVYETTEREHAAAIADVTALIAATAETLGSSDPNALTVINTLPFPCTEAIALPATWRGAVDGEGRVCPVQQTEKGPIALLCQEASSIAALHRSDASTTINETQSEAPILENDLIRYVFNADGELVSAFDKTASRELIPSGKTGNRLTLYVDRPNNFEAWDLDIFYSNERTTRPCHATFSPVKRGAVRTAMTLTLTIGNSTITQTISLRAGSKRLDFVTHIQWHEKRRILRVAFPADISAGSASYDIQYGYLSRVLHANTSWDNAKFEVPAHRYADLSEAHYGVALLNDCKYGYRVQRGELSLSLLRSSIYPDFRAEEGEHQFTYAYLPHDGSLTNSCVMAEAENLNRAPVIAPCYTPVATAPFHVEGNSHVTLEVMKRAEKSEAIVLRLVERAGEACHATLVGTKPFTAAESDLLEWHPGEQKIATDGKLDLTFTPFEIKTLIINA